jgi:hypothetical protein
MTLGENQNHLRFESSHVGLDFILSHFRGSIWPRTISTAATYGAQVLVYSKEEALARFKAANLLDCRINAYPAYTEYKGINRQVPNFIFIDLDRCIFTTERAHKAAVGKTLKNISSIGSEPTVLWTGNGCHIYLSVDAFVLEQQEIFAKFDCPSKRFLKFAAQYLSNYKSDPYNNPSFKSCMVRIPGSHNSKCSIDSEVKIIQKCNGRRPNIRLLLGSFYTWLVDKRIKELEDQRKRQNNLSDQYKSEGRSIQWIEQLLQTPIQDHRKFTVWRILAPYLLNVKKLSNEDASGIISKWLDKCDKLHRLNFYPKSKIKEGLSGAAKGYYPISFENLRQDNTRLYDFLLKDDHIGKASTSRGWICALTNLPNQTKQESEQKQKCQHKITN